MPKKRKLRKLPLPLVRQYARFLSKPGRPVSVGVARLKLRETGLSLNIVRSIIRSPKEKPITRKVSREIDYLPPAPGSRRFRKVVRVFSLDKNGFRLRQVSDTMTLVDKRRGLAGQRSAAYRKNIDTIAAGQGVSLLRARQLYTLAKREGARKAKRKGTNRKIGAKRAVASLIRASGDQSPKFH